jgi:NAD(P)-dependent dehydrogenase (short-subunit alcohol dehydrogenase family)
MTEPLAGARALVIGGGSGIGLGTARLLARDGARVTIAGRTEVTLERAAADLASEGLDVAWVRADALDAASVRGAVDVAARGAGGAPAGLDIAVVVPGGGSIGSVLLADDDRFSREVDQNVRPAFLTIKYAGRAMVRSGGGSVVAISSTAAAFSTRYLSSYAAGKAAVDQLVRVAADELGELGVRVNAVRPGLTRTATTHRTFERPAMLDAFVQGQAIGRPGEVADVAAAVRYLAGPESGWVTGQHLAVDGGHTLRAFVDYGELLDLPDVRSTIESEDRP